MRKTTRTHTMMLWLVAVVVAMQYRVAMGKNPYSKEVT
jgi:hypothetical protein